MSQEVPLSLLFSRLNGRPPAPPSLPLPGPPACSLSSDPWRFMPGLVMGLSSVTRAGPRASLTHALGTTPNIPASVN